MKIQIRMCMGGLLSMGMFLSGCVSDENISVLPKLSSISSVEKQDEVKREREQCKNAIRDRMIISGDSMTPLLHNNDKIWFYKNYYEQCNETVKTGDLIEFTASGYTTPFIKKVVATHEDILQIKNNTLWVNGEEYKNSVENSYQFTNGEISMLKLFISENHIPENSLYVLGDNISNSIDSRKFGVISQEKVLGKFELYSE